MATTVTNKTQKPLGVPLPRGKTLHLGPGKSGEIASNAVDHPPLQALIASGAIEVLGPGVRPANAPGGAGGGHAREGHTAGGGHRRSGDR